MVYQFRLFCLFVALYRFFFFVPFPRFFLSFRCSYRFISNFKVLKPLTLNRKPWKMNPEPLTAVGGVHVISRSKAQRSCVGFKI
jgi:hypothetical protein